MCARGLISEGRGVCLFSGRLGEGLLSEVYGTLSNKEFSFNRFNGNQVNLVTCSTSVWSLETFSEYLSLMSSHVSIWQHLK